MKKALLILALSLCGGAFAGDSSSEKAMRERLAALYPSTKVDSVRQTPVEGLFEVVMGKNLAYVDASGRYFLLGGHLYDLPNNEDLTEARVAELQQTQRIDRGRLGRAQTITVKKGSGARELWVFTDPLCPHCRRFDAELEKVTDVTIHNVIVPMQPGSESASRAIVCAADPNAAWRDAMREATPGRASAPSTCKAAVELEGNLALAEELGIRGTPSLVSGDGRVRQGAMNAADLSAWLAPAIPAVVRTSVGGS